MHFRHPKITFFFISVLLFTLLFSCKRDEDRVPYAYVDFYIDIMDPEYNDLTAVGNSLMVTGGVRGIILYHKNLDEFIALERNCTNEPYNTCEVVSVDSTGIYAICDCCGSKYTLYDGFVVSGPAKYPLNTYRCSFNPVTNILHVFN